LAAYRDEGRRLVAAAKAAELVEHALRGEALLPTTRKGARSASAAWPAGAGLVLVNSRRLMSRQALTPLLYLGVVAGNQ
jgi:hypothetical protein